MGKWTKKKPSRKLQFKVTTSFMVNSDLCYAAYFVWAIDEEDARDVAHDG